MRSTMLGIMVLALLAACRGSTPPAPDVVDQQQSQGALDDTVLVRLGDDVRIVRAGLVISFDSVLSDSRCPRSVQCVWAGSARVRLTIGQDAGAAATHELESGRDPRFVRVGAYVVSLLDVEPQPEQGREIGRAYRVRLRITHA